ncbi:MAG: ArsR family transcriptional regulator [Desulfurellales bacterium]|nr:MAG: ArsR family transcriptional regulator [Desulfurellales bacterium]
MNFEYWASADHKTDEVCAAIADWLSSKDEFTAGALTTALEDLMQHLQKHIDELAK